MRNESVEQAGRFQKIDEERQLPKLRQRRLGIPFDMHRAGETVEADALWRAFVFNQWKPSLGDDLVQNLRMALKSRGRVDLKKGVNDER
jgi:hypothetical protein